MHGNINQLVCPSCGVVVMMTAALLRKLKAKKVIPCSKCDCQAIRCRIMLYDDAEDDVITPEDVFDVMEEDVQKADLILWVGISFEQSASTAYFRRVRQYLMEANHLEATPQAIVNITEEALWNLMSACSNTGSLQVLEILSSSDTFLPLLAAAMTEAPASHQAEAHIAQQGAPQLLPVTVAPPQQQQQSQQTDQLAGTPFPRAQQLQEQQLLNPKLATLQQQQREQLMTQPPLALQQQQASAIDAVDQAQEALQQAQLPQQKRRPRQRSPGTEQHTLVASQQQQQQHHMQTRRQLGHQVAQLQQLDSHQQKPQLQPQLRQKLQQQLPKPRQRHEEQSQDGTPQAPQQQQQSATRAAAHLLDAQCQSHQSQDEQACVDGQIQQQQPAHQVQSQLLGSDELQEIELHHKQSQQQVGNQQLQQQQQDGNQQLQPQQQARYMQGLQPMSDQQQLQQQMPSLDALKHVRQVQQGMHAAEVALQQQGGVQASDQEHAPSLQHGAPEAVGNRHGALTQQECQALTAAIKTSASSQQVVQQQQQQQQALGLQAEPSEAELCLLKPTSGQVLSAAYMQRPTLQQLVSQSPSVQHQLGMLPHSHADDGLEAQSGVKPGLHLLNNPEGQTLRLVEGQLLPDVVGLQEHQQRKI